MTVDELRTLVDNLDEYIHVPGGIDRLKKVVLHLAVSGQLVPQDPSEGTGEELYQQIQAEKAELARQGKTKKQKPLPEINESEMPFKIPKSWKWVRTGEISRIHSGTSYRKSDIGEDIRILRGGNVVDNGSLIAKPDDVFVSGSLSDASKRVSIGDIVIVASTGSTTAIGKPSIVDTEIDAQIGAFLRILRANESIDRGYFWIYIQSDIYRGHIRKKVQGTNINNIKNEYITENVIPLPSLPEQKRIVAKVDSIFALIDQLSVVYKAEQAERTKLVTSSLAQLASGDVDAKNSLALTHLSEIIRTKTDAKTLRQTILHLAISGQLVPQDPAEGTGEELYQQIQAEKAELVKQGKVKKQKPLPEISEDEIPFSVPNNWKWVRQSDIFDIASSKRVMQSEWKKSGIPFLRARDLTAAIKTNEISSDIFVSHEYFNRVKELLGVPQRGDLMVSGVGTIGTPYIVKDGDEFYFKDATILWFKNFSNVSSDFMKQVLLSDYMKKKVKSQSQGTTVDTYTIANARMNIVPLPPIAEQKRIVAKTTQLLGLVAELEKHLEK